jgi:hypothetical protein
LPRRSIKRTQIVGKIVVDKYPALPGLGTGSEAQFRAPAQFLRVELEEYRSFDEREGFHGKKRSNLIAGGRRFPPRRSMRA